MSTMEVEDDIYTGYNDYPSVYDIKDLEQDELFQEVMRTSYGKRSIVSIIINYYISNVAKTLISNILCCIIQYLILNCNY